MTRLILVAGLGLCVLAACQEADGPTPVPAEPAPEAAPAVAAEPPPRPVPELSGKASASSNTAMSRTGDAAFDGAMIRFERGFELATAPERIDLATAIYDASGATWAQLLQAPEDSQVELRRVVVDGPDPATRQGGLCGPAEAPAPVGYVALIQEAEAVHMAVFAAGPAPGPQLPDTALCGTFLYHLAD